MNTDTISDGKYCADIEYFNPESGTKNIYNLFVEVENNSLIKIYWPNGGWLDDSHFEPTVIKDNIVHITSDRGYEYEIEIGKDFSECERCYEIQEELKRHDSILKNIEARQQELEMRKIQMEHDEFIYENRGYQVVFTGCKDFLIIKYNDDLVVAKRIGNTLPFEAGDKLDCTISKLGITTVGNLTQRYAGNIEVFAIEDNMAIAEYKLDKFCDQYMKTWSYK
jgi:hypothetical protein